MTDLVSRTIVLGRLLLASALLIAVASAGTAQEIPYPETLDDAAVAQQTLSDLEREALIVGNGDLNALIWGFGDGLRLRIAKNDIWDARIDTSADPPMLKVDLAQQTWSGGEGAVPSWQKPYPTPRCAAVVDIGRTDAEPRWHPVRGEGSEQAWSPIDSQAGIMAIAGSAGASAGYRLEVRSKHDALEFKMRGTAGARYYVTLHSGAEVQESGWRDSPQAEQTVTLKADAGPITAIVLYVMTVEGSRAENVISDLTLSGGGTPLRLVAGMPPEPARPSRLDLRRAVAEVGATRMRALADRNVLLIESDEPVSLAAIPSSVLPASESGEEQGVQWLRQTLPGDVDYPGMEFAVAVAARGRQKAVAVVTSRETPNDVRQAAIELAQATAEASAESLITAHEEHWRRYWSASGVELSDATLQAWWYRMVYMLGCMSKPGVVPPGLWAFQPDDAPNWHGDYHHNYNAWQPFWSALIVNHPEAARPWIDYLNEQLPRLKWLARETYACEGACVGISTFAYEPDPANCQSTNRRQIALAPWGYTVGMMGMSAQVAWHHQRYAPDRDYLEAKIYPLIRETALFYASFAEQCPPDEQGQARFGPSYSPEHGQWGVHNVPFDLAYARFSLKAGIAAARELERDAELGDRFQRALQRLPDYPTAPDAEGRPIVVDWSGCAFRQIVEHNITVPAVPVFPAEQVTWFSPEPVRALFLNTLRQTRHRGCNATVMLSVAKARLGMREAIDELRGYYQPLEQPNGMFYWPMHGSYLTESVGIAAAISEFLVQSVEGTVRVFPCWPRDVDARFSRLRAEGGFLVTAEQKAGEVTAVAIHSTVGGTLRLVNPWTGAIEEHPTEAGQTVVLSR